MNVLFVCNLGQNRSKTAEYIFKHRFKTKSAGLYNNKSVTKQQLLWADTIVVMENVHRREIATRFPDIYMQKRILVLNIHDIYRCGQPELISILQAKVSDLL